jgi:hypothetical protein
VTDNSHVVTGGTAERTTIRSLLFDVGEDGTFGDGGEREDVADGKSSVLSSVDELQIVSRCPTSNPRFSQRTWPVYMPSFAMKTWVSCLNLYGLRKVTLARGAPVMVDIRKASKMLGS